jgi:hypothetical protein
MLLRSMCGDLEGADRRTTTAVKLILAYALVAGSTSLVRPLMGNRVLHRRPFPERDPSTLRLHLGTQLLLERRVVTETQTAALPARGVGALSSQGTYVTCSSWNWAVLPGTMGMVCPPGQVPGLPAVQGHDNVVLKARGSVGAAFAAVAHSGVLTGNAPVRRDVLLETPGPRPSV